MAKEIATKESVFSVADQLLNDGIGISTKAVQSRIGGGSFTTVKRYLDAWAQERKSNEVNSDDLPEQLRAILNRIAIECWGIAKSEARSELDLLQRAMAQAKSSHETQLKEVLDELQRLEGQEVVRIDEMRVLVEAVRASEIRDAAMAERLRAAEATQEELNACREQLRAAQEKLLDAIDRSGRLEGQLTAMKSTTMPSAPRKHDRSKAPRGAVETQMFFLWFC